VFASARQPAIKFRSRVVGGLGTLRTVTRSPFPSRREIKHRARQIYLSRGRPPGSYRQFWRDAEQALLEIAAARTLRSLAWPARPGAPRHRGRTD